MSDVHRSNPSPGTMMRYQWEDYQRRMNFQFRHMPDVAERQARGVIGDGIRQLFDPLLRGIRHYEGEVQSRIPGNQYPRGNPGYGGGGHPAGGVVYRGENAWQAADRLAHEFYPSRHIPSSNEHNGYRTGRVNEAAPTRQYGAHDHVSAGGPAVQTVLRENSQSIIVPGNYDAGVQTFPVRSPEIEVRELGPIGQQDSSPLPKHQAFVENTQAVSVAAETTLSKHPALDSLVKGEMKGRFSDSDPGIYARAAAQLDKFGL
ncbi:MAG: hypothetical protein PHX61_14555 [Alphaproteobacteria bacterium]|nr:hypothetical protein [Alphaproteobacteria bacterium]